MSSNGKNRSKSFYFQQRTQTKILHLSLLAFTDITLAKTLNKRYACIESFDFISKRNYLNRKKVFVEKKVLKNNCKNLSNLFPKTKKYNIKSETNRTKIFTQNTNKPHHNCNQTREIFKKRSRDYVIKELKFENKQTINDQGFQEVNSHFKKDVKIESTKENINQTLNTNTILNKDKIVEIKKNNKIFTQSNSHSKNVQKMNTLKKLKNLNIENKMTSIF